MDQKSAGIGSGSSGAGTDATTTGGTGATTPASGTPASTGDVNQPIADLTVAGQPVAAGEVWQEPNAGVIAGEEVVRAQAVRTTPDSKLPMSEPRAPLPSPHPPIAPDPLALYHSRGYVLIPIHGIGDTLTNGRRATGKEPVGSEWQRTASSPPIEVCRRWRNWGVLPAASGLAILDVEPAGLQRFPLANVPRGTLHVLTPSGGYHLYLDLAATEAVLGPLKGKRRPMLPDGRLDPNGGAELISRGGQCLGPGSIAYSAKAKREGTYVLADAGAPLAVGLDAWLEPFKTPKKNWAEKVLGATPAKVAAGTARAEAWATALLSGELGAIASAPEGTKHDVLLSSASRIGQAVGSGMIDAAAAQEQIVAAAVSNGWDEREARRCAKDAIDYGRQAPRGPREDHVEIIDGEVVLIDEDGLRAPPGEPSRTLDARHATRTILIPGTHKLPSGEVLEVSHTSFSETVLKVLPADLLYRRDRVPGRVIAGRFVPADVDDFRRLCDPPNVRLVRWGSVKIPAKDGEPARTAQDMFFENCSPTHAALIKSAAADQLPNIDLLTTYPVLVRPRSSPTAGTALSPPGYHTGTYYAGPAIAPWTDAARIRAHLLDLVADFPFEDDSSRANFLGLLLTPMLRPRVGKVPLHLVTSPTPGTGKSRLVEEVLGITYMGEPLSSSILPERAEERAKWLTSLLLAGDTLVHLDNLPADLDSANLASLVTSARVSDRLLGGNTFARLDNTLTIAATGNNTRLSAEIARRTIVIRLAWKGPGRPDERTSFVHPDLAAYVLERRLDTLGALAGACLAGLSSPAPAAAPVGGFEAYVGLTTSCLAAIGIPAYLANRDQWRQATDFEEQALMPLLSAWADRWGGCAVQTSEVLRELKPQLEEIMDKPTPRTVGILVGRLVDRTLGAFTVRRGWSKSRSLAYWVESSEVRESSGHICPESGHAETEKSRSLTIYPD